MKIRRLILAAMVYLFILNIGLSWGLPTQSSATSKATTSNESNKAAQLNGCTITALSVYFWRDWMPIVEHPGTDHGSPLYAKAKLLVDNTAGGAKKFSCKGMVIDEKGESQAMTFQAMPDYRLLPDAISKSYPSLDEKGKGEVLAKYNVIWDGSLKPGEVREVEMISHDGPYLPVGSRIHVEFTFTDQQSRSVIVKTPTDVINRTD